jgi:glycosyltransferase involved in cell wall biosynthesis
MNILWITWKSSGHPEAGGAEAVCYNLCKRMLADGHSVTLLTTTPTNPEREKKLAGLEIIRVGSSRYVQPLQALIYYIRHLRNKYDIVIEEVNGGAPYFAVFFGRKSRRFALYHQLGWRNWKHEFKAPISWLGYYVLVPIATRLMGLSRVPVITVSESSRTDLAKFGLPAHRTHIISEGLVTTPIATLDQVRKFAKPTVLSHGGIRGMKRTIDQVKAFEIAKKRMPELQMKISGTSTGKYGQKVFNYIAASPYAADIEYLGRTSDEEKLRLMQQSHVILVTSIEEGWGLIVTEANSQGTPAVVYDVNGLRDSVRNNETGLVTENTPDALADGIVSLLSDTTAYERIRRNAWEWSKQITFEQSYADLQRILGLQS